MDDHLPLVRDVLDKQVLDPDKCKIGKVDGILLQLRANRPPRVTAMEISQSAAWRRLHPRLGDLADWLRAKCEPGQDRPPRRVELLLGKKVHAPDGTLVGRIEEFRAERENSYWVVTEFHLGPTAVIERLAVRHFGFTLPGPVHGYRVRWDQIDLEDADHPRLTCDVRQLARIGAPRTQRRHRRNAA